MAIETPYVLFLADAQDQLAAKTGQGIADWRPDWCRGQVRLSGCKAALGLPDMTLEEAGEAGIKTLVVGVANRGGVISDRWIDALERALGAKVVDLDAPLLLARDRPEGLKFDGSLVTRRRRRFGADRRDLHH